VIALRRLYRLMKRFGLRALGLEPRFRLHKIDGVYRLGSAYGGWDICLAGLDGNSVVYSFGLGTDVSFDIALINAIGCTVHGFDPTPASLDWLSKQTLPSSFVIHPIALTDRDGSITLYPPADITHISHSVVRQVGSHQDGVEVPAKRLSSIMNELNHDHIDLLKMDIEGSECDVLVDLAANQLPVGQIAVEFHPQLMTDGWDSTKRSVALLESAGYQLYRVSDNGKEFSFTRFPPLSMSHQPKGQ
jgi:FkbM family methyltransferase